MASNAVNIGQVVFSIGADTDVSRSPAVPGRLRGNTAAECVRPAQSHRGETLCSATTSCWPGLVDEADGLFASGLMVRKSMTSTLRFSAAAASAADKHVTTDGP